MLLSLLTAIAHLSFLLDWMSHAEIYQNIRIYARLFRQIDPLRELQILAPNISTSLVFPIWKCCLYKEYGYLSNQTQWFLVIVNPLYKLYLSQKRADYNEFESAIPWRETNHLTKCFLMLLT
jgi:hypothetical protein